MMKQNSVKEEISMNASFHTGNRKRLYEAMKPASLLVMFSGEDAVSYTHLTLPTIA